MEGEHPTSQAAPVTLPWTGTRLPPEGPGAALPPVTTLGLDLGTLLGGAVITGTAFASGGRPSPARWERRGPAGPCSAPWAGVRTGVRTVEWGTSLNKMVYAHAADPMDLIGRGHTTRDADRTYHAFLPTGEVIANDADPAMDKLLEEAQVSTQAKRRRRLDAQVARLIREEVPALPLCQQVDRCGASRRVYWEARPDERPEMRTARLNPAPEERR